MEPNAGASRLRPEKNARKLRFKGKGQHGGFDLS